MTQRSRLSLCFLATVLWSPIPTAADDEVEARPAAEPEVVRVEEEAERRPTDLTAFATRIRREDFDARITSLAELLEGTVGLHVRSFGGLGAFATVSLRGSTAEQVNIYVDGVLLNTALGGGVNLSDIPLDSIESIDIYRGFTPTFLDSASIGGAIDIRTRRPGAGHATNGSLSFGSYETVEVSATASWAGTGPRRVGGLVSFNGRGTRGDFRFWDNNGTFANGSDDGYETRVNNRSWIADLLGRTGFALEEGGRLQFSGQVTRRRQGVPGIDAFQSESANAEMTRTLVTVGYEKDQWIADDLSLDLDLAYVRTSQEFSDQDGDTTGGRPINTGDILQSATPSFLIGWKPGPHQSVTVMTSARLDTADRTDALNPISDRGRATRWTWNIAAEDELHLAGGRFVMTPSLRWSRYISSFDADDSVPMPGAADDSDEDLAPRLGMAWFATPGVSFRANVGRFYRIPNFMEIFGNQGSIKGNGSLHPEEGLNYDIGMTWSTSRTSLETVLFQSLADDLIQFVQVSQSQVVAANTGQARITGVEASFAFGLWGKVDGSLNYTWQHAEDRSDTFSRGSDLPGRPRHEGAARIRGLFDWGIPYYRFDYIGPTYFDTAAATLAGSGIPRDEIRVPGRYFHGFGYTRRIGKHYGVTVEVDNIFNIKTVDVVRYPLPGRMVQVELRVTLP